MTSTEENTYKVGLLQLTSRDKIMITTNLKKEKKEILAKQ